MSERTVVYLMSYPAHAPYLSTSLLTLRRHWAGNIEVYAWKESIDIVRALCHDKRIGADAIEVEPEYRGKNDQFLNKIKLLQMIGPGPNLYLDADTLVYGPLTEMFLAAEYYGFAATQFCDWDTGGKLIRNRLERLYEFPSITKSLIEDVTTNLYPSVNGGVIACTPHSPVLPIWHTWSFAAKSIFICDECVLHLMPSLFEDSEEIVVMPGVFNSSPKYVPKEDCGRVRIWHGHGDCWVRPAKSREGWTMWNKEFQEARRLNLGNIESWFRQVGNKYLDVLIREGEYAA